MQVPSREPERKKSYRIQGESAYPSVHPSVSPMQKCSLGRCTLHILEAYPGLSEAGQGLSEAGIKGALSRRKCKNLLSPFFTSQVVSCNRVYAVVIIQFFYTYSFSVTRS